MILTIKTQRVGRGRLRRYEYILSLAGQPPRRLDILAEDPRQASMIHQRALGIDPRHRVCDLEVA